MLFKLIVLNYLNALGAGGLIARSGWEAGAALPLQDNSRQGDELRICAMVHQRGCIAQALWLKSAAAGAPALGDGDCGQPPHAPL